MNTILGLRFRENGQIYSFDAAGIEAKPGQYVLVNSEQGAAMARVAYVQSCPDDTPCPDFKPILRAATPEDMTLHEENLELAAQAISHCRQCIDERGLDMKLVDVEILLDRSKMIFYFTAPGRIDFRDLVKDLVKSYRARIELRQIGVRHETQMIGALGNCGQMCCCARFIRKFQPVTIKMAKEQNLFLNPTKISGICGRLLCCLAYEQGAYEEFQRRCPKIGKKYQTTQGPMKVLRSNLFREVLSVAGESGEETEMTLEEWKSIAGETWTSYVPSQQAPQGRVAPKDRAPRPSVQAAPPHVESVPANDDGEAAAAADSAPHGQPRKRKRKRKPRRPDGATAQTPQPGE